MVSTAQRMLISVICVIAVVRALFVILVVLCARSDGAGRAMAADGAGACSVQANACKMANIDRQQTMILQVLVTLVAVPRCARPPPRLRLRR